MALFPQEFIVGLLAAFLQFRLRASFSLASLLVNGLSFFLPPDDELIATLNGRTVGGPKAKATTPLSPDAKMEAFYVKVAKTEHGVFQQTLFYELYEMLVIIVSSTLAACCVGDTLAFARPWLPATLTTDVDAISTSTSVYGLVSALLVALWFPLQIQFAQSLATYEARLGLGVGALGFVLAFFVLLAPKPLFDFDMERAADVITGRVIIVLQAVGIADSELATFASVGAAARTAGFAHLALLAGVFTSTAFLPAFRFARMYAEMTAESGISLAQKALLHVNMLAPLLVAVLWVKPLALDVFVPQYLVPCSPRALMRDCFATAADEALFTSSSGSVFVLTESQFATMRVYIVLASVLVRLVCFRTHLQFFLLEIREAIVQLVRRPGAVDGPVLQSKVRVQFNYLPIIAVQYLAPVAAVLASVVLLARQTGTSLGVFNGASFVLTRVFGVVTPLSQASVDINVLPDATPPDFGAWRLGEELEADKLAQFVKGMAQFTLVTSECHASLFGFFLWWLSFTWFAVSVAGLVYWKNVPHYADVDESAALLAKRNRQTPKMLKNQLKGFKLKKQQ